MSYSGAQRPPGTDGTDYRFRQRVVAQYMGLPSARRRLQRCGVLRAAIVAALIACVVLAVPAEQVVGDWLAQLGVVPPAALVATLAAVASAFELLGFGKLDSASLILVYFAAATVALVASVVALLSVDMASESIGANVRLDCSCD